MWGAQGCTPSVVAHSAFARVGRPEGSARALCVRCDGHMAWEGVDDEDGWMAELPYMVVRVEGIWWCTAAPTSAAPTSETAFCPPPAPFPTESGAEAYPEQPNHKKVAENVAVLEVRGGAGTTLVHCSTAARAAEAACLPACLPGCLEQEGSKGVH